MFNCLKKEGKEKGNKGIMGRKRLDSAHISEMQNIVEQLSNVRKKG